MLNFKKNLLEKINRRNLLRSGIMLPGIALLSLGSVTGCDNSAQTNDGFIDGEFLDVGDLTVRMASREFSHNTSIEIEADTCGWGWVQIGRNTEYAHFFWNGDANVTLQYNSANVATTDTDDSLCIFDNGTNLEIKNNLSTTLTMRYALYYSAEGLSGGSAAPSAPTAAVTTSTSAAPSAPIATT